MTLQRPRPGSDGSELPRFFRGRTATSLVAFRLSCGGEDGFFVQFISSPGWLRGWGGILIRRGGLTGGGRPPGYSARLWSMIRRLQPGRYSPCGGARAETPRASPEASRPPPNMQRLGGQRSVIALRRRALCTTRRVEFRKCRERGLRDGLDPRPKCRALHGRAVPVLYSPQLMWPKARKVATQSRSHLGHGDHWGTRETRNQRACRERRAVR